MLDAFSRIHIGFYAGRTRIPFKNLPEAARNFTQGSRIVARNIVGRTRSNQLDILRSYGRLRDTDVPGFYGIDIGIPRASPYAVHSHSLLLSSMSLPAWTMSHPLFISCGWAT